jgi:hypothetical protein
MTDNAREGGLMARTYKPGDRITALVPGTVLVPGIVVDATDRNVTFRHRDGVSTSLNHSDFVGDDKRPPWFTDEEWNARVRAWESIETAIREQDER